MPYHDPDPTDPNMLVGVMLPADAESTRDMAYVFAEEFARMGHDRQQIIALFKNPYYGGAHGAYRALGEKETLAIIDECLNVWGSIRIRVQDVQAVQTDQTPTSVRHGSGQAFLPRVRQRTDQPRADAGEACPERSRRDEGGGWNDWNDLTGLNAREEEESDDE
ncbi:MAG: hypothetical protein HYV01_26975 [Deltaproteobacteria bacterium]|nr:hypothetical protein [Deltaproteobacteria bacterium]